MAPLLRASLGEAGQWHRQVWERHSPGSHRQGREMATEGGHWGSSHCRPPWLGCDSRALGSSLCFLPLKLSWRSLPFWLSEVCASWLSATERFGHMARRVKRNGHPCSKNEAHLCLLNSFGMFLLLRRSLHGLLGLPAQDTAQLLSSSCKHSAFPLLAVSALMVWKLVS